MLQTLKKRTLVFLRSQNDGYTNAAGKFIKSTSLPEEVPARGSLQPLTRMERETIPSRTGTTVKSAFYFYTKTEDIRPVDKDTKQADTTTIAGVEYVVWANTPWDGVTSLTSHNVITLVRVDEVAFDE